MAKITAKPKRPALGHFADWIRPLRLADELPALANRRVRAAIHEAPLSCRPSPVEAWLFEAATDHDNRLSDPLIVGGLRLRRVLDDWTTQRERRLPRRRGMGGDN